MLALAPVFGLYADALPLRAFARVLDLQGHVALYVTRGRR